MHHLDGGFRKDGLEERGVLRAHDSVVLALEYPDGALEAARCDQVDQVEPEVGAAEVVEAALEPRGRVEDVRAGEPGGTREESVAPREAEPGLERGEAALGHPCPVLVLHHARRRGDEDERAQAIRVLRRDAQRGASAHRPSDEDRAVLGFLHGAFAQPVELVDVVEYRVSREEAQAPRALGGGPSIKNKGLHIPSRSSARARP